MGLYKHIRVIKGYKGIPARIQARAHGQRIAPEFVSVFWNEKKAFPICKRVSVHYVKSQCTRCDYGRLSGYAAALLSGGLSPDRIGGGAGRVYGRTYGRGDTPLSTKFSKSLFQSPLL